MKALLYLALLLAISSAAFLPNLPKNFTPRWKILDSFKGSWTPVDVSSQTNPLPGQYNLLTVCGTAQTKTFTSNVTYTLTNGAAIWQQGTFIAREDNLFKDSKYCFNWSYKLPQNASSPYSVIFTLNNLAESLASIQIDF